MKIACTGPNGKVGRFMVKNYGLTPLFVNIEEADKVNEVIDEEKPDVILHLAGISDPDYCEDPNNRDRVIRANLRGSVNVFRAASERNIITVYLSTSQIFPGGTFLGIGRNHKETDRLSRRPTNFYALSKMVAEAARLAFDDKVKVVRTSHLFDYERLMNKIPPSGPVETPSFIKRSYIYLPHFAHSLYVYLNVALAMPAVLHIAGTKTVSEYDLMDMFLKLMPQYGVKLKKRTKEIEGFAPRPHYSGLDVSLSKRLGLPQYNYIDGLLEMSHTIVRG